jgi:hypothetical protein
MWMWMCKGSELGNGKAEMGERDGNENDDDDEKDRRSAGSIAVDQIRPDEHSEGMVQKK